MAVRMSEMVRELQWQMRCVHSSISTTGPPLEHVLPVQENPRASADQGTGKERVSFNQNVCLSVCSPLPLLLSGSLALLPFCSIALFFSCLSVLPSRFSLSLSSSCVLPNFLSPKLHLSLSPSLPHSLTPSLSRIAIHYV